MKARQLITRIQNVIVLVLLLGAALSANGQVESGRFVGRVIDVQGAAAPHAIVKATNTGTNIVQSAITDSSGDFVITPVSAGVYSLSVTATGFQTINSSNIEVQVGQVVREDLELKVGEATTTVEVYTDVPLLSYTTMKYGKLLLTELHDLNPVPVYIRAHHLLTSGNGVAELKWSSSNVFTLDANGKPVYDFTITDQTFDEFQKAGVRPMVELGFMPKDLAAMVPGVNDYQIHYPGSTISGASNNPPKDYAVWGELVKKYTEHLVQRYGKERVATWYFEVWNEPDIAYWHATPEEYDKLYDYAVAGVRAALPNAIVGGPASTGPASGKASVFLDIFLKHCINDKSAATGKPIPLDFISFHPKGRPTVVDGHVRMGLANELKAASEGFRIVAKYPKYIHLPIILSEADPEGCAACSMKVNPSNAYRNGPLYPVYTAVAIKGLFALQDRYKVNLLSMLSWSFEFEDKEYFEGFRTLATNGVDKPVINVFRMAGLMSGQRVSTSSTGQVSLDDILNAGVRQAPDVDAFMTKANDEAAVMLWNYHDDDVPAAGAAVQVTIAGIPAGVKKVLLQDYRIDETHSNSYAVWKKMGSPQSPTAEQYSQLREAGQLQLLRSPEWLDVNDGKVTIATTLPRQATSLMHVKW